MIHSLQTIPVWFLVAANMALAGFFPVLADGDSVSPHTGFVLDWQSIVGTMGVTGVLVWYLWFTTSSAFPKMRDDFREEMTVERKHHSEMVSKTFERMEKLCDSLDGISEELRSRPCLLGKEPKKKNE